MIDWEVAMIEGQLLGPRYPHTFQFATPYTFVARVAEYDYYMGREDGVFKAHGLIRCEAAYYYYPLEAFAMPPEHCTQYESLIKHIERRARAAAAN